MRILGALLVSGWLLLPSCGRDNNDPDTSLTKGEYCESTGTAFCQRVQDCRLASFSACFKLFQGQCCLDDDSCDVRPPESSNLRGLEERCVGALSAETCADVEAEVIPDACGSST